MTPLSDHPVVSPTEWLAARQALLIREKELTRLRDEIAAERRTLPWQRVTKDYAFDTIAGPKSLAELFEGRRQLIVYHFMLGPGWEEGCASCSYVMDHIEGALPHLAARDTTFTAISRAPLAEVQNFKQRMGWKFSWASSHGNDFNADYRVSFTPEQMLAGQVNYNYRDFPAGPMPVEELPGASVFFRRDDGAVFHTYSVYARGLDPLIGTYQWLDLTPKGRDEESLSFSMAWVRHHDRYEAERAAAMLPGYQAPKGSCCRHESGQGSAA